MATLNFLFAWSVYVNDSSPLGFHPVYFAVASDLTIYSNDNWEAFYAHTRCYCEHSKKIYCNGFLKSDEDAEIFEHKSYRYPFIIVGNSIKPLKDSDITMYEIEHDPEARHWASVASSFERD